MKASELTVHECALDGETTSREPWIEAGEGSAFVPRLGEVVHIRCAPGGLAELLGKVQQLVDKGFHALVVDLGGEGQADPDLLLQVHAHVERFLGWVGFIGLPGDLGQRLQQAADERGLELVQADDLAGALEALKQRGDPPPSEAGPVQEGAGDWGWGSSDVSESSAEGLPKIDVVELFVEASELPGLPGQVATLLEKGRNHVTLRLHVPRDRRMRSEDVTALSAARDQLDESGGLLVLLSPQQEFLQWLRLLDEEKNFVIVEAEEEAQRLHRQQAARGVAVLGPALELVSSQDGIWTLRAPEGETVEGHTALAGVLIDLAPAGLPALGPRVHALAAEGVQDVIVDLGRFQAVEGQRYEPLVGAVAAARAGGMRIGFANVSHEVQAFLRLLHLDEGLLHASLEEAVVAQAGEVYLRTPFAEGTFNLQIEPLHEAPPHQDPVSQVEFDPELSSLERPNPDAELNDLRADLARASGEQARLREELAARDADLESARREANDGRAAERQLLEAEQGRRRAEKRAEELEQQLQAREQRVQELEQSGAQAVEDLARARQRVAELEQEAPAAAPADAPAAPDGALAAKIERLELEKARILTEAEDEIRRLLQGQQRLREELESAGDMIERLGKELELS